MLSGSATVYRLDTASPTPPKPAKSYRSKDLNLTRDLARNLSDHDLGERARCARVYPLVTGSCETARVGTGLCPVPQAFTSAVSGCQKARPPNSLVRPRLDECSRQLPGGNMEARKFTKAEQEDGGTPFRTRTLLLNELTRNEKRVPHPSPSGEGAYRRRVKL
jgi:hypothetical protein